MKKLNCSIWKYPLSAAALLLMLSFTVSARDSVNKADEYLEEYYNIKKTEYNTLDSVNEMLDRLGGEKIEEETLTDEEIIAAGIRLAGLEDLALTYISSRDPVKVNARLRAYRENASEEYAPYAACALDMGLIQDVSVPDAAEYLYKCAEIADKARRYIGRVSDKNILSLLSAEMSQHIIFEQEQLEEVGQRIVLSGAATGYSLKYAGNDARFLSDYTVRYSHSDREHAIQLIGLLRSEDLDAFVQVEPKISVYEYLSEWGDPGEPTPTYEVRQETRARYLCYSVEYDLVLEFDTKEDKESFHGLIENYAKKYDESYDKAGNLIDSLLYESWWQPLYFSETPVENEEFEELTDNVIYDSRGEYSIHSFTLPENAKMIRETVFDYSPDITVNENTVYANPAFIRYLTGEDHQ